MIQIPNLCHKVVVWKGNVRIPPGIDIEVMDLGIV